MRTRIIRRLKRLKVSQAGISLSCVVSLVSLTVGEGAEFLGVVATCVVRESRFNYALFEGKSGLFRNVLCGSVRVKSDQKAPSHLGCCP